MFNHFLACRQTITQNNLGKLQIQIIISKQANAFMTSDYILFKLDLTTCAVSYIEVQVPIVTYLSLKVLMVWNLV